MITFDTEIVLRTEGLTDNYENDPRVSEKLSNMRKHAQDLGISLSVRFSKIVYYRLGDYVHFNMTVAGGKLAVRYFIKHIVKCTDEWNEQMRKNGEHNRYYI